MANVYDEAEDVLGDPEEIPTPRGHQGNQRYLISRLATSFLLPLHSLHLLSSHSLPLSASPYPYPQICHVTQNLPNPNSEYSSFSVVRMIGSTGLMAMRKVKFGKPLIRSFGKKKSEAAAPVELPELEPGGSRLDQLAPIQNFDRQGTSIFLFLHVPVTLFIPLDSGFG